MLHVAHLNAEQKTNNADLHTTYDCGNACICNIEKQAGRQARSAKWYAKVAVTPRRKIDSKQTRRKGIRRAVGEVIGLETRPRPSGIADDDSSSLLAQYTSLFGLGAPVPAFLSTEKTEHA